MKSYKVELFDEKKNLHYAYLERANNSKEAKEKAKSKTTDKTVSARVMK